MNRFFLLLIIPNILCLFFCNTTIAQLDSLFVEHHSGNFYLRHKIKKGQTLYSLKKFYNIDIPQINFCNPGIDFNDLAIGQIIRIPVSKKIFKESKHESEQKPIYYKIKPKETLYNLCKNIFNINLNYCCNINKLPNCAINENQKIILGYLNSDGIHDSLSIKMEISDVIAEDNMRNKKLYEKKLFINNLESQIQGIAYWESTLNLSSKNKLYVLCSKVETGAIVRIENPMTRKYLYAEVVEKKPENSNTLDALIVLTPAVAKGLSAIDSKFHVKVYYVTN